MILHCSKRKQDIQILVGTNKLSTGGSYYRAAKTIPHENFNKPLVDEPESGELQFANDIALIQTETPIKFNKNVNPIEFSNKEVEVNAENLQITAFGILNVSVFFCILTVFAAIFSFVIILSKLSLICRKKAIDQTICKC